MKTWKKIALTLAGCATLALGGYFLKAHFQKEEPKTVQAARFTEEDYKNILEIEKSRMNFIKDREDKTLELLLNFANDIERIKGYKRAEQYLEERRFLDSADEFERNGFYAEAGFIYYNISEMCIHIEMNDMLNNLREQNIPEDEAGSQVIKKYQRSLHHSSTRKIPNYAFHNPDCRMRCPPALIDSVINVNSKEGKEVCSKIKDTSSTYEKSAELFKEDGLLSYAAMMYKDSNQLEKAKELYLENGNYGAIASIMASEARGYSEEVKEAKLMEAYEYAIEHQAYSTALMMKITSGDINGIIETYENFILPNPEYLGKSISVNSLTAAYASALLRTGQREKAEMIFGDRLKSNCLMIEVELFGELKDLCLILAYLPFPSDEK